MIITFKSAASGDVIMMASHARKLLEIIGKDANDTQGIVTVEQVPVAIEKLMAAMHEDQRRRAEVDAQAELDKEEKDKEEGRTGMAAPVALAQRAWPLLDMLQSSQKESVPVIWGV